MFGKWVYFLWMILLIFMGCGKKSDQENLHRRSEVPGSQNYHYRGMGSVYDVVLGNDGTFTLEVREKLGTPVTLTMNGIFQRLSSGFVQLTVTSARGPNAPTSGEQIYGLEVPGAFFVLKDMNAGLTPMIIGDSCPTMDFTANWVTVRLGPSSDVSAINSYGTFDYEAATGTLTNTSGYSFSDNGQTETDESLGSGTCSDGIMSVDGMTVFLTSSGEAIIDRDHGEVAVATLQTPIESKDLKGNYLGGLIDHGSGLGFPFQLEMDGEGRGQGQRITDWRTGETGSPVISFEFSNENVPQDGFIQVSFNISFNSLQMTCSVVKNIAASKRDGILCLGPSPINKAKLLSAFLISQ